MRENSESSVACHHRVGFLGLLITLGIVFGDIGTSPLYVMKAILHTGEAINESTILGALSCIIWTLTLQTTIKYVCVALRADNNGEGAFSPSTPVAQDEEKMDLLTGHHRCQHPAGRWNHHPCHHGYHSHRRTRKHQSPPASHPHHTGHHHHHLLCATLWHREHRQVVRSIHADMVPAAGRNGSFQHHLLPIDSEGIQPLLCCHAAGKISRVVPDSGCRVPLYTGAEALTPTWVTAAERTSPSAGFS